MPSLTDQLRNLLPRMKVALRELTAEIDGTKFDGVGMPLGRIELEDGRTAQVQLKIVTDENEFIG